MSITYKILEVHANKLKVDVGLDQWAWIPIQKGQSKADIEANIRRYGPQNSENPYDSTSDVPFAVDDTATITDIEEENTVQQTARNEAKDNEPVTWRNQRQMMYPSVFAQLDALYWARKGDNAKLTLVDSVIDEVKSTIAKDAAASTNKVWNETYVNGTLEDRAGNKKLIAGDYA
tara:strand:+ start:19237 stop:19761 length:525 start_codon:yes stop_codon:yes gene_type:complete